MSWGQHASHHGSRSANAGGGCLSRSIGMVFSLGLTGVILLGTLGTTFYFTDAGLQGKVKLWRWDKKKTFKCDGQDNIQIDGEKFKRKKGRAILASGFCQLECVDCKIEGPTAIVVTDNAKVTLVGGRVKGKKAALRVTGNGSVSIIDAKIKGKIKTSGNGTVTGLEE